MPAKKRQRVLRPSVDWLDDRCLLSGVATGGLTPSQITEAYSLNAIQFKANDGQTLTGNGAGETIAIIDAYHDPDLASDLNTFDATYNLPSTTLVQLNESGGAAGGTADSGWAGEETMDVEWAHAIAPGATIVVVEANSDSLQDMMAAVSTARNIPGVVAVSMSWGGSESADQLTYDSLFTTPAGHAGITFIAASGDQGSAGGAEWPASSINVLAVGGTSLSLAPGGTISSETTWSGSSGGYSRYEPEPSFQDAVQSTGRRSTPDVSFDADPNTGVEVYTTDPTTGVGSWQVVGGTSLGAPAWAAIIAIADEGRAANGLSSLDGATQTLPALYSFGSADFHSTAASTSTGGGPGGVVAEPGGRIFGGFGGLGFFRGFFGQGGGGSAALLGSPNGSSLIADLVGYTGATSTGSTTSTGGTTTSTGGGTTTSTGGGTTSTGGGTTSTPPIQGSPGLPPIFVVVIPPTSGGTLTTTPVTHTPTHRTTHNLPKTHVPATTGTKATHTVTRTAGHVAAVATHKGALNVASTPTKVASNPVEAAVAAPAPAAAPIGLSAAVQIGGLIAEAAMIPPNDLILAGSAPLPGAFRSSAAFDAALRELEDDDEF